MIRLLLQSKVSSAVALLPASPGWTSFQWNQELSEQSPRHRIKAWEQQQAEESLFLCLLAQMHIEQTAKDAAIYSGQKLKGGKETQGRDFSLLCMLKSSTDLAMITVV